MPDAFICDAIRTPIGRYGGALASVRTDDLAALPIAALMERNPGVDWAAVDDVVYGCANQAGEDNRNVARMALLLAGLPDDVPGHHGQPAVRLEPRRDRASPRARSRAGETVADDRRRRREHDARAVRDGQGRPSAFSRAAKIEDTTIGWRFVNPLMKATLRHRLDAGDRRERRRRVQASRAPTRTPSRCAASSARRRRSPRAGWPRRSCR